jgi:hypothetical protein
VTWENADRAALDRLVQDELARRREYELSGGAMHKWMREVELDHRRDGVNRFLKLLFYCFAALGGASLTR